jgi:hypothetical protein
MEKIKNKNRNRLLLIGIITLGVFVSCTKSEYKEIYTTLNSDNFYLHYPDTTTIVNYSTAKTIYVVEPDSFKIPFDVAYAFALDTITGTDASSKPIDFSKVKAKTTVNIKTGVITLDNTTKAFVKDGNYQFFISINTYNGVDRFRDKPINVSLK